MAMVVVAPVCSPRSETLFIVGAAVASVQTSAAAVPIKATTQWLANRLQSNISVANIVK
jgi:hypothetical protein